MTQQMLVNRIIHHSSCNEENQSTDQSSPLLGCQEDEFLRLLRVTLVNICFALGKEISRCPNLLQQILFYSILIQNLDMHNPISSRSQTIHFRLHSIIINTSARIERNHRSARHQRERETTGTTTH